MSSSDEKYERGFRMITAAVATAMEKLDAGEVEMGPAMSAYINGDMLREGEALIFEAMEELGITSSWAEWGEDGKLRSDQTELNDQLEEIFLDADLRGKLDT